MMTIDPRFYELAAVLNRGGAYAHYWIPSRDDGQKYSFWYPVNGHVPEPPANWTRQDLYYSVNPAGPNVDRSVHTKIHKGDVAAVSGLYAEFDQKDWPGEAELVAHVATIDPLPSAIVRSGGGYHCYWLLADTYEINTAAARQHIDQVQTAWVGYVKGDPTVHDLARVLRVPGTQNFKYSPPRDVSFVRYAAGCVYELPALVATMETAGQWPPKATQNNTAAGGDGATLDDQTLLEKAHAANNGAQFGRLWAGDITDYRNDQSAADLALCVMLAFWTRKDEPRMGSLFRQSGLMRPKWDRDEYRERTIRRACDSVFSVYEPGEQPDQEAIAAAMSAINIAPAQDAAGQPAQPPPTAKPSSVDKIVAGIRDIAARSSDPADRMRLLRVEFANAIGAMPKSAITEIKLALQTHLGMTATNAATLIKNFQADVRAARQNPQTKVITTDEYIHQLKLLGYSFRWNQCYESIEVNGRRIDDGLAAVIRSQMRDLGFIKVEAMEDAYTAEAYNHSYHPIKDYLNSLQWDGNNHIATLCSYIKDAHAPIKYAGGKSTSVFGIWLSRWLLGAVAKVFAGGTVRGQNPVLVLDGAQNLGKSTFALWLGSGLPDMFIEEAIRPDDKECARWLASKWIWEVPELGSTTRRQDREALKSFITRHEVSFRKPYDRHPVTKPAMASFVGTINNEGGFLTDPTGNRRFLTVKLESIDWRYMDAVSIHQLWAQVYHLYQQGQSFKLNDPEIAMRDALNGSYEMEDVYESRILELCNIHVGAAATNYFTTTLELIEKLKLVGIREPNERSMAMHIATACRHLKLETVIRVYNGSRQRGYLGLELK